MEFEVFEEWLVTGVPDIMNKPYEFIWTKYGRPDLGDPEVQARRFCAMILERNDWLEGPHLFKRIVIKSSWEGVELNENAPREDSRGS